jgi:DNA-binding response OmpR family regulator
MRVLVVEDEPDIAALIKRTLERTGDFQVDMAVTGEAGLDKAAEHPPAVIIVDLNLPVLDGLEVCRILRARDASATVPIIMVTARTSETDRIRGLDIGVDDCITSPFTPRELSARVRMALQRSGTTPASDSTSGVAYRGAHLIADFDNVVFSVDGIRIRFTRREFELLRCLVQNRNRVLSRDRLLEHVWGYSHDVDARSVDVHIGRLRGKLGTSAGQIETIVGLGYRFVE